MTMNNNELLSALIDGELDSADIDRALALLNDDSSSKEQLQRFQRHSDVLRGYGLGHNSVELSTRISQALADEPAYAKAPNLQSDNVVALDANKRQNGFLPDWFWQQAMGLAIAASIGALAVVGVWQQSGSGIDNGMPIAIAENGNQYAKTLAVTESIDNEPAKAVLATHRWTVGEPEVADRLNTYLVDHNEYAGTSVFSNARVIAYEVE